MRWLVVFVAMLLIVPAGVSAETTPEPVAEREGLMSNLPDAEALGIGWVSIQAYNGTHEELRIEQAVAIYAGPRGARILAVLYDLSPSLTRQANEWIALQQLHRSWADFYAGTERDAVISSSERGFGIEGVGDALWYQSGDQATWGLPFGVALYAFDTGHAMFLVIDGSVGELWGVKATNQLAAAVAAALNGVPHPSG